MSRIRSTKGLTVTGSKNTGTVSLLSLQSTRLTEVAAQVAGQIPSAADITSCVALYIKIIGYEGPLFNLRRSSDGSTLDVYSIAEAIDFLAGGEGTIAVWYDQTGNNNDFFLAAAGSQPILEIENSVTGLPTLQFGLNRALTGTLSVSSGDYAVVYHVIPTNNTGSARCLAGDVQNWLMGPYNGVLNMYAGSFAGGTSVSDNDSLIHAGYKASATSSFHRINGASAGTFAGATYPSQINMGTDNPFAEPARSSISEYVSLNTASTDRIAEIENSMIERYTLVSA